MLLCTKWECFSDSEETCANIISCLVNSEQSEQDTLDTDGSGGKKELPKVLTFQNEKDELTPERIKVRPRQEAHCFNLVKLDLHKDKGTTTYISLTIISYTTIIQFKTFV